jgi:hypothetical protein
MKLVCLLQDASTKEIVPGASPTPATISASLAKAQGGG